MTTPATTTKAQDRTIAAIEGYLFSDRLDRQEYRPENRRIEALAGGAVMFSVECRYGESGHFLLDETYIVIVGRRGGMRQVGAGRGLRPVRHPFQLHSTDEIARASVRRRERRGAAV